MKNSELKKIVTNKQYHLLILLFIFSVFVTLIETIGLGSTAIFVIILTVFHFYLASCLNNFRLDKNTKNSKFFRIINEVPTILLILSIFVVIFKPL